MTNPDEDLKLGEPIPHSQIVQASRERVWQVISEPGNLVNFHPFCERNPVENWPGVGSRDTIYYYNGLVLVRDFTAWVDRQGYDLIASAEEGLQFKVSWRILSEKDGYSKLNLTIRQILDEESELIFVANAKGVGSRNQRTDRAGYNTHDHMGTVSIIPLPDEVKLAAMTETVDQNNSFVQKVTASGTDNELNKLVAVPQVITSQKSHFEHVV